jgi:hypothetical protein
MSATSRRTRRRRSSERESIAASLPVLIKRPTTLRLCLSGKTEHAGRASQPANQKKPRAGWPGLSHCRLTPSVSRRAQHARRGGAASARRIRRQAISTRAKEQTEPNKKEGSFDVSGALWRPSLCTQKRTFGCGAISVAKGQFLPHAPAAKAASHFASDRGEAGHRPAVCGVILFCELCAPMR